MENTISIYQQALEEKAFLERQIGELEKRIKKYPKGKLICCKSDDHVKWYLSENGKRQYIPKKKRKFAEQLALKRYEKLKLQEMMSERMAIDFYLRHHSDNTAEKELLAKSGFQELLEPYFKNAVQEFEEWMHRNYETNTFHQEQLIHKTCSGIYVRSKSEAMILMLLEQRHIPNRYESELHLGNRDIYPDFTLIHPKTGKMLYWEHFGMMDDAKYYRDACAKLEFYLSNQIYPLDQLIVTFETKENPLTTEKIEKTIQLYFG